MHTRHRFVSEHKDRIHPGEKITITASIDTALTSFNVMGEKGIGAVTEKLVPFMAVFCIPALGHGSQTDKELLQR